MKESTGYALTLNIVLIFIIIIFTFISSALVYYKSHKVTNVVVSAIDEYEGYNSLSKQKINNNLVSLGYNVNNINCSDKVMDDNLECPIVEKGSKGYCVYLCEDSDYYYYKVSINMMINIPLINNIMNIPIYSNSSRLYNFEKKELQIQDKKGNLEIIIKDYQSGKQINSTATFAIYNNNNCTGNPIQNFNVNEKGSISLDIGNYSFKEIIAPENYYLDFTCYAASITENNTTSKTSTHIGSNH